MHNNSSPALHLGKAHLLVNPNSSIGTSLALLLRQKFEETKPHHEKKCIFSKNKKTPMLLQTELHERRLSNYFYVSVDQAIEARVICVAADEEYLRLPISLLSSHQLQ